MLYGELTSDELATGGMASGGMASGGMAAGKLATGGLAAGDPAAGDSTAGDSATGNPAVGTPTLRERAHAALHTALEGLAQQTACDTPLFCVDATLGNGWDTLFLLRTGLFLRRPVFVHAFDVQQRALQRSAARLAGHGLPVEYALTAENGLNAGNSLTAEHSPGGQATGYPLPQPPQPGRNQAQAAPAQSGQAQANVRQFPQPRANRAQSGQPHAVLPHATWPGHGLPEQDTMRHGQTAQNQPQENQTKEKRLKSTQPDEEAGRNQAEPYQPAQGQPHAFPPRPLQPCAFQPHAFQTRPFQPCAFPPLWPHAAPPQQEAPPHAPPYRTAYSTAGRAMLHLCGHEQARDVLAAQYGGTLPQLAVLVFNLGFLPGAKRRIITQAHSTLAALDALLPLLACGGLAALHMYAGHAGGAEECRAVMDYMQRLPRTRWRTHLYDVPEKTKNPEYLALLQRVGG